MSDTLNKMILSKKIQGTMMDGSYIIDDEWLKALLVEFEKDVQKATYSHIAYMRDYNEAIHDHAPKYQSPIDNIEALKEQSDE